VIHILLATLHYATSHFIVVIFVKRRIETGVELAEKLAARFGTRNNGEEMTQARRNKYVMQEEIRKKGVRAVTQKLARTADEVKEFCAELASISKGAPFKCVVKPNESAGTDSVFLCNSPAEVGGKRHFIANIFFSSH